MTKGWREFAGAWDDYRQRAEEYCELDGNRVLVLSSFGGRRVVKVKQSGSLLFQL